MSDESKATSEFPAVERSLWWNIAKSWLSLRDWVKTWLIFLNIVLLGSLAFLYDPIGKWVVIGYAASAPLLLLLIIPFRGLTRLLGLAHIVPWTPLLAYLIARLLTNDFGPQLDAESDPALFVYTIATSSAIGLCLAWDFYDVYRWLAGERYV